MYLAVYTSVIIDFLRTTNPQKSVFYKYAIENTLCISILTVCELYSGQSIQKSDIAKDKLEKTLSGIEIIIPSLESAIKAGALRSKYSMTVADAFIAQLALDKKLPLLTLDTSDFHKIKELEIIK